MSEVSWRDPHMSEVNWKGPLGESYRFDSEIGRDFFICEKYGCTMWCMVPDWRDLCSLDFDYIRVSS